MRTNKVHICDEDLPVANVEKVNVALTPEMAATMRQVVETGEYASASEVMREALREWKLRREQRAQAMEDLGRQWDAGLASGGAVDGEQVFARIRKRLDAKLTSENPQ
jgi:antitoxin ParD1/3/4